MNFGILVPIVAILASAWVIVATAPLQAGGSDIRRRSVGEAEENARLAHENEALAADDQAA